MNKLKTMKSSESVEQQKLFAWAEIAWTIVNKVDRKNRKIK